MTRDRVANPLEDTTRTAAAQPAAEEAQPAAAYLVVLSGSNVGEMYRLEKDQVVVGRGDKVDLRLVGQRARPRAEAQPAVALDELEGHMASGAGNAA